MREEQPMRDDGWDGVHLGEATAHAWLDGALPPDEAARAAAHVATCADCTCLLYTSPSPRDLSTSRMPSSA